MSSGAKHSPLTEHSILGVLEGFQVILLEVLENIDTANLVTADTGQYSVPPWDKFHGIPSQCSRGRPAHLEKLVDLRGGEALYELPHILQHDGLVRFAGEEGPHCVRSVLQSEGLVASHHQLQKSQIQASDIMFLKMRLFYCNPEDGFNNEVVDSEVHINVMHTSQGCGKFAIINAVMFTFWNRRDQLFIHVLVTSVRCTAF